MSPIATLTGHNQRVLYSAISPDGQTVVTGAGDETLRFWHLFPSKATSGPPGQDEGGAEEATTLLLPGFANSKKVMSPVASIR